MTGLSIKGMMRLVYLGRSINFICTVYLAQKYTKFHVYRINNCFCCEVSCIPYCFKTFLASLEPSLLILLCLCSNAFCLPFCGQTPNFAQSNPKIALTI